MREIPFFAGKTAGTADAIPQERRMKSVRWIRLLWCMSSKLPRGISYDLCLCDISVSEADLATDQSGLDHCIPLWVECHSGHWRPVAGLTAPAPWITRASLLI